MASSPLYKEYRAGRPHQSAVPRKGDTIPQPVIPATCAKSVALYKYVDHGTVGFSSKGILSRERR